MTHLVVIDLQHVFGDPTSPWGAPRFGEIRAPIARLVEAFGDDVTFTRFVAPARPSGAWRAYYEQWPFALQGADARLWDLTDGFAAQARHVVEAATFGKWGPSLAALAQPEGRLVLAGVSTDCCVLSTALAAADAGIEVLVAADACAGADDDSHAKALHIMDLYRPLVRVTTVAQLLAEAQ